MLNITRHEGNQIKIMRYHGRPIRMAQIKKKKKKRKLTTLTADENAEQREPFLYCWWESKMVHPFEEQLGRQLLKKLNMVLPYNPAMYF